MYNITKHSIVLSGSTTAVSSTDLSDLWGELVAIRYERPSGTSDAPPVALSSSRAYLVGLGTSERLIADFVSRATTQLNSIYPSVVVHNTSSTLRATTDGAFVRPVPLAGDTLTFSVDMSSSAVGSVQAAVTFHVYLKGGGRSIYAPDGTTHT